MALSRVATKLMEDDLFGTLFTRMFGKPQSLDGASPIIFAMNECDDLGDMQPPDVLISMATGMLESSEPIILTKDTVYAWIVAVGAMCNPKRKTLVRYLQKIGENVEAKLEDDGEAERDSAFEEDDVDMWRRVSDAFEEGDNETLLHAAAQQIVEGNDKNVAFIGDLCEDF